MFLSGSDTGAAVAPQPRTTGFVLDRDGVDSTNYCDLFGCVGIFHLDGQINLSGKLLWYLIKYGRHSFCPLLFIINISLVSAT